jgi:hypothetical protein
MEKNVHSKHVVAVTSPLHYLTDQQRLFVDQIIKGKAPGVAARIAGYANPEIQGHAIVKSPKVQAAIKYLYKKHEKASDMTRKKVMDGMLEAIDMARMQADAGVMVSGWREIGRMCGYYAPEVKKIDISISAKRVIDKLETLSDEDLLQLVEESSQIIEVQATEILDDLQKADEAPEEGNA